MKQLTINELTKRAGKNAARWLHDVAGFDFCKPFTLCEVERGAWQKMTERAGVPADCSGWTTLALLPMRRQFERYGALRIDDATKGAAGITVGNLREYRSQTLALTWRSHPDTFYAKREAEESRKAAASVIIVAQRSELTHLPTRKIAPDARADCRAAHAIGRVHGVAIAPHHIRMFGRLNAYKQQKRAAEVAAYDWQAVTNNIRAAIDCYYFELLEAFRKTTALAEFTRLTAIADGRYGRPATFYTWATEFQRAGSVKAWRSVEEGEKRAADIMQGIREARQKLYEVLA